MKKIIITMLLAGSMSAYAGVNGLTAHSRANCLGFNESISWDATRNWDLRVEALHSLHHMVNGQIDISDRSYAGKRHTLSTGDKMDSSNVTWREAQLHINDPMPDLSYFWMVYGTHYRVEAKKLIVFEETQATNCNIYDGWWEKDYPERKS